MFRFNNPDALLVLLLVAGAYCLIRALEGAGTRWILAAGAMIGFAFLAKMMQAFLVLPAFAPRLPGRRADRAAPADLADAGRRPRRSSSAPAGGWRSSRCGRPARGR